MRVLFLLSLPLLLIAQELHQTPQQIQEELQIAEAQFIRAQKMFNPWYTGPLLTPSASMMPVANGNLQPYLFVTENYASFNKERKSVGLPNDLVQLKSSNILQTGVTPNFDIILVLNAMGNWQNGHEGGGFGDLSFTGGFLINKQSRYVPQMKLAIGQTFPTGKYKNLNSDTLDGTGAGAYSTQFSLAFSKILFWATQHPMNVRLFFGYELSTVVDVTGYNAYGGGVGTAGKVRPGNNFSVDLGIEYSLTQRWVLATDIVYTATDQTKFHGDAGTTAAGLPAAVGTGYSDNLSLAPAIEYNWNENLGVLAGMWFSVYGRNSTNFLSGVFSVCWTFP